ncbi:MAG: hypothetical protein O7G83_08755, partial [Proteobacteria bacterium]|nr:hypothetical protein [Pseudomonadota bacterium]
DLDAASALNVLVSAQEDFRDNDRDKNEAANYWVRSVTGLHAHDAGDGPIKRIEPFLRRLLAARRRRQAPMIQEIRRAVRANGVRYCLGAAHEEVR